MPNGRPTKFNSDIESQVYKLAEKGWTNAEIAEFIEVAESTLYKWMAENDGFSETIKEKRILSDDRVEHSLYERALGYKAVEKEFTVDEDGNQELKSVKEKQISPDPTSAIFWLKNRRPEQWREKQEVQNNVDLTTPIPVFIPAKKDLD